MQSWATHIDAYRLVFEPFGVACRPVRDDTGEPIADVVELVPGEIRDWRRPSAWGPGYPIECESCGVSYAGRTSGLPGPQPTLSMEMPPLMPSPVGDPEPHYVVLERGGTAHYFSRELTAAVVQAGLRDVEPVIPVPTEDTLDTPWDMATQGTRGPKTLRLRQANNRPH